MRLKNSCSRSSQSFSFDKGCSKAARLLLLKKNLLLGFKKRLLMALRLFSRVVTNNSSQQGRLALITVTEHSYRPKALKVAFSALLVLMNVFEATNVVFA